MDREDLLSRKWQPVPVFLPGKFQEQRSLASYSPWSCKESDMIENTYNVGLSSDSVIHVLMHIFIPFKILFSYSLSQNIEQNLLCYIIGLCCLLLLFSRQVVSDSLWPHGLQHTLFSCPLPSPGVCPSSCPLHQWCHPASSSSVTHFSSCPPSFPASGSFPISWLFISGAKVSELQFQHQSFHWVFRIDFL